jgi:hypothetical protein
MRSSKTDRYLKRAEKARRHAEEMAEEASQRLMLRIAREYEDFAKRAPARCRRCAAAAPGVASRLGGILYDSHESSPPWQTQQQGR